MTFSAGGRLGIDFGTSHTVAAVAPAGRPIQLLLFDATPLLPSGVCVDAAPGAGGRLLTGRDAELAGRRDPALFEPNPKRLVDDGSVLLGDRDLPVVEVIAATMRRVADEATRVLGREPVSTVLTHPAAWGPRRRAVLLDAAARAGLGSVSPVPEPVAAAVYFTQVLDHAVPVGSAVAVYDLGAGTFDTTVLRRGAGGWEVLAGGGLAETGGLDLDAAIVDWIGAEVGARRPEAWRELLSSPDDAQRRLRHALWADARIAKEQLSRTASAVVPVLGVEAHLTREEFEQLARPFLRGTVELTATTVTRAGLRAEELTAVFLVGGGSRIPAVATMLHRRFGVAPTLIEQPELVVAQGSLAAVPAEQPATVGTPASAPAPSPATVGMPASAPSPATVGMPASAPPSAAVGAPAPAVPVDSAGRPDEPPGRVPPRTSPPRRRLRWLVAGVVAIVVLLVGYAAYGTWRHGAGSTGSAGGTGSTGGTGSGSSSVPVNRTVWYGGLRVTFTTASLDASRLVLRVAVKVDNTGTAETAVGLPVTMSFGGDSAQGTGPGGIVGGSASTSGTVTFDLRHPVTDLRAVTLIVGDGDEVRATVPFDAGRKVADLAPVTVPLSGTRTVGFLAYTLHGCEARADFPRAHKQAKSDQAFVICTVDAQLVGPTNLDYGLTDANFRLALPDGTIVGPATGGAPADSLNPRQLDTNRSVAFAVPGPPRGRYTLQLRDPGRLGNDTPTGDKVWNVAVDVP